MELENVGADLRRGTGWVLKALAVPLTFGVVFAVTRFFDRPDQSIGGVPAAAALLWWLTNQIPVYRRRRRAALLERLSIRSPELATAALQHFRWQSRARTISACCVALLGCYGLVSTLFEARHRPLNVLGLLACLVTLFAGVSERRIEADRLRTLAAAASGDEAERWRVVRSFARFWAKNPQDRVSQALWRRIEPESPQQPASTASREVSLAAT